MKKLLLLCVTLGVSTSFSWSQCSSDAFAADSTICPGDSVVLTAIGPETPLETTYAAGNNHRGNMFDITAINTVTITAFDGHPMATTDIEIYYKVGSYAGSETNAAAWTLVGTATNVVPAGTGIPTPIPITIGVTIPAGQTYAFYVTSTNTAVSLNYTNGASEGAVYASDGNIQFLEGIGMEYPFAAGGSWFTPRLWNGTIHYSMGTTFLWSTGETTPSITVAPTTQTTYTVDVSPNGCPTTQESVNIYMNSVPVVDLGADTTVCPGSQVLLDAGNPGMTYSWNNGFQTTQVISVLPGTSYFVEVINTEGCSGYDTIDVIQDTPPTVDLGGNEISVCPGETTILDAGNAGSTFDWNTGATTQTIDVGLGSYSVTVTNSNGCTGSDNITISEFSPASVNIGADQTICVNESTTIDAGAGYNAYLWSSSETTQSISVDGATLGAGTYTYTVEITDSNGCTAMDTMELIVDPCLGIGEINSGFVKAYPNPTADELTIELSDVSSNTTLKLFAADGKLIVEESIDSAKHVLSLQSLAEGTYVLEIHSDHKTEVMRVVKN